LQNNHYGGGASVSSAAGPFSKKKKKKKKKKRERERESWKDIKILQFHATANVMPIKVLSNMRYNFGLKYPHCPYDYNQAIQKPMNRVLITNTDSSNIPT
jgi:hypothetical protein